jgi:hypothetical protein
MFPAVLKEAMNPEIEAAVAGMQAVIQLGRQARDRKAIPIKVCDFLSSPLNLTMISLVPSDRLNCHPQRS